MNKLWTMVVAVVAVTTLTGCNRGWPKWLCRGDTCAPGCGYEGADFMSTPTLLPPTVIPATPRPELPSPGST